MEMFPAVVFVCGYAFVCERENCEVEGRLLYGAVLFGGYGSESAEEAVGFTIRAC